jgi:alkylation response protein AidB-like acyl-CoA dehydrogenase
MQIPADTTLIEAARRIAPVIREHNQEAERERRLSPPVLAALHEAGLLRMCTPRSLGGLEVDPLTRSCNRRDFRARHCSGMDPRQPLRLGVPLRPLAR